MSLFLHNYEEWFIDCVNLHPSENCDKFMYKEDNCPFDEFPIPSLHHKLDIRGLVYECTEYNIFMDVYRTCWLCVADFYDDEGNCISFAPLKLIGTFREIRKQIDIGEIDSIVEILMSNYLENNEEEC